MRDSLIARNEVRARHLDPDMQKGPDPGPLCVRVSGIHVTTTFLLVTIPCPRATSRLTLRRRFGVKQVRADQPPLSPGVIESAV